MDENKASQVYRNHLSSGLWKLRIGDKYTDFTIRAGNREFKCHRVILAAMSDYFETMFDLGGIETQTSEVCLDDIGLDEESCEEFLKYIYTGENVVTMENADILLYAAHLTQIRSLHILCKEYLKTKTNKSNCVRVWQISQKHEDTVDLAELSRSLILKHFAEIAQSEEKLDYLENVENLSKILQADNVNVVNKSLFCVVALSWIIADFENRYQYFTALCEKLLVTGVAIEDIVQKASEIEEFHGNPEIQDTLERLRARYANRTGVTFNAPTDDAIVIIGGSEGGNNSSVMFFSFPQKIWYSLKPIPQDPGYNFALCSNGLDLYVSGGSGPGPGRYGGGGGTTFLQFVGKSNEWLQRSEMPRKLQYHVMYAVGDFVFVLGGKDDSGCSKSVYKYDIRRNTWSESKTKLYEAVRSPAHTCVGSKIYLLGGFGNSNSPTETFQYFDCQYDHSSRVHYTIPDFARVQAKAVNYNGNIVLICKNGKVLKCSEKHETRKMAEIAGFDRKGFGACSFEDKILIFGGEVNFTAQKDMLLCDVRNEKVQSLTMQETIPLSLSNFCFTKAMVLREHLLTPCGTSLSVV